MQKLILEENTYSSAFCCAEYAAIRISLWLVAANWVSKVLGPFFRKPALQGSNSRSMRLCEEHPAISYCALVVEVDLVRKRALVHSLRSEMTDFACPVRNINSVRIWYHLDAQTLVCLE